MAIRLPIAIAAAAEFGERAVGIAPAMSAETERRGDAAYGLRLAGEPIRIATGPGFVAAGSPRKPIPGQTYH